MSQRILFCKAIQRLLWSMGTFGQMVLDNKIITRYTNILFAGITMAPQSIISITLDNYLAALILDNCTDTEKLTFQLNGNFASGMYTIFNQPTNCSFSTPKFTGVPLCVAITNTTVTKYGSFRITLTPTCIGMFSLISR